jgi:hypothetical protein
MNIFMLYLFLFQLYLTIRNVHLYLIIIEKYNKSEIRLLDCERKE